VADVKKEPFANGQVEIPSNRSSLRTAHAVVIFQVDATGEKLRRVANFGKLVAYAFGLRDQPVGP